jgi:Flp pilus assembly protein TadB
MLGYGALLALVCGLMVTGGVCLSVWAIRGREVELDAPAPVRRRRRTTRTRTELRLQQLRYLSTIVIAVLVWWWTGLLLTALFYGSLPVLIPWLFRPTFSDKSAIERSEALEEWTRRLSSMSQLGQGLEQSLRESVETAPAPIKNAIERLASRLRARWTLRDALLFLADELGSTGGDTVCLALLSADENRGPGLSAALDDLAGTLAEQSRLAREIEARRGESRITVRMVTSTILAVVALGALDSTYVTPYQTPMGALVLVVLLGLFAAIVLWMRRLIAPPADTRLLPDLPKGEA